MADWIESVEEQLKSLENRVYGNEDVKKSYSKCVDRLAYFNSRLNSAVTGRDKITNTLKKINDIERFLDPEYVERMTLPDSAKLELIASEEENIRQAIVHLEKVEELKPVLNSEHIKNTPNLNEQLLHLSEIQLKQQADVNSFSDDVLTLIESYNSIIQTITKQFIHWDDVVTKMEVQAELKQRKD